MSDAEAREATQREFDEVMRSTRFATIEQVAADLADLPASESTRRVAHSPMTVGVESPDLPSRRRLPAG